MPAKGTTKVTTAQRRKIAAGRIGGKTAKQIAGDTGLAVDTVNKQGIDPRTQTLIQRLKERDGKQLDRIWKKTLNVIEKDLSNIDPVVRARLARTAVHVITSGDPPLARIEAGDGGAGQVTMDEFLLIYRRRFLAES